MKLTKDIHEPIFTRQEQAVVYLFSRYWEKIDVFHSKRKSVRGIQTHFPDAWMVDKVTGTDEAIEFEYALSSFNAHIPDGMGKLGDYSTLYIVYWEHDDDENKLKSKIKKRFHGDVVFVCLKNYFTPYVQRVDSKLEASWVFQPKQWEKPYSFNEIMDETYRLIECGLFHPLTPVKHLYRTTGFNTNGSDFIECGHWTNIHYYTTTTRFQDNRIPSRLFVKPRGCKYFYGFFDVKQAFKINKANDRVREYFDKYYFYPYESGYKEHTCFVYSKFRELSSKQGVQLFKYLDKSLDKKLRVRSSLVIGDEHRREIDKIFAPTHKQ